MSRNVKFFVLAASASLLTYGIGQSSDDDKPAPASALPLGAPAVEKFYPEIAACLEQEKGTRANACAAAPQTIQFSDAALCESVLTAESCIPLGQGTNLVVSGAIGYLLGVDGPNGMRAYPIYKSAKGFLFSPTLGRDLSDDRMALIAKARNLSPNDVAEMADAQKRFGAEERLRISAITSAARIGLQCQPGKMLGYLANGEATCTVRGSVPPTPAANTSSGGSTVIIAPSGGGSVWWPRSTTIDDDDRPSSSRSTTSSTPPRTPDVAPSNRGQSSWGNSDSNRNSSSSWGNSGSGGSKSTLSSGGSSSRGGFGGSGGSFGGGS